MPAAFELLELHHHRPEVGVWCPYCNLPSAVRVRWACADAHNLKVVLTGTHDQCLECGRWWEPQDESGPA